ncbi:unnamed protein product, partial [Meganyctiphanes norvegica]
MEKDKGMDNHGFEDVEIGDDKTKQLSQQDELDDALAKLDTGKPWDEMSTSEKVKTVLLNIGKVCLVLCLLYLFICSLDFLQASFRLISGRSTGDLMSNGLISNPIVGLMIGILITVLVQSSSTSTSIIVSMVSSGLLSVHVAIPMIMGANIGTSVTNTIVSLTQVGDREEFRRAFGGATVHDMFNWLSVFVLLTIEMIFGMLEALTTAIMEPLEDFDGNDGKEIKILKALTEPFTKLVIQLDKNVIIGWGNNNPAYDSVKSMVKTCWEGVEGCTTPVPLTTEYMSTYFTTAFSTDDMSTTSTSAFINDISGPTTTPSSLHPCETEIKCGFLFSMTGMSDTAIGAILLLSSLILLCSCLIGIVKVLNSAMKGSIAIVIKKTINANIPYVPWLTGYLAILIGTIMTFILQSSSVFTSTLTPLIGIGLITVERAYPLTLGSNIGTTTTTLLASLAGDGDSLHDSIQIALVHLFFNIFGILIFFPIPFMRFPIPMAKGLGNITAQYRWFAIVYLIGMFFVMPGLVFLLSLVGAICLKCNISIASSMLVVIYITNLGLKLDGNWAWSFRAVNNDWNSLVSHSPEGHDSIAQGHRCNLKCKG